MRFHPKRPRPSFLAANLQPTAKGTGSGARRGSTWILNNEARGDRRGFEVDHGGKDHPLIMHNPGLQPKFTNHRHVKWKPRIRRTVLFSSSL